MSVNRRTFLKGLLGGLSALWAGYMLWATEGLFRFKPKSGFLKLGSRDELSGRSHKNFDAHLLLIDSGEARLVSRVCTHKGCLLEVESDTLRCPCHEGLFTRRGALLQGEPEEPLERYAIFEKGGILYGDLNQTIPLDEEGFTL